MNIKEEITDFGKVWYVSNEDNTVRFALYRYNDDLNAIYLSNVFVDPVYRNKGIGNAIVEMAIEMSISLDAKVLLLKVLKKEWMHTWYSQIGFEDFQTDSEDMDYIWMRKEL